MRYIVVDQAERLVDTALPGVLLRLHELSGAPTLPVRALLRPCCGPIRHKALCCICVDVCVTQCCHRRISGISTR